MIYDVQKASTWKRIAAWIFDGILVSILAVGFGWLLSLAMGYNSYNQTLQDAYDRYESEYNVEFDVTPDVYSAFTEEELANYDKAYQALIADEQAMYAYSMVINQILIMTAIGILLAVVALEFVVPLFLGNGQTLGKKIFSLCLVRNDGVKLNNLQLFTRTVLGKYAVETMIPVYLLLMLYFGNTNLISLFILFLLALAQCLCLAFTKNRTPIHDLMVGTVVADFSSQMIFRTTEDLIAYKNKVHAEHVARQTY